MVEFYDPDAGGRDREEADVEVELPEPAPTIPKPGAAARTNRGIGPRGGGVVVLSLRGDDGHDDPHR